MFLPELVQDVCGVEAGVVTQLSRDDLQRLGHGPNQQLLLARYGARVVPQVLAELHLYCTTACTGTGGLVNTKMLATKANILVKSVVQAVSLLPA